MTMRPGTVNKKQLRGTTASTAVIDKYKKQPYSQGYIFKLNAVIRAAHCQIARGIGITEYASHIIGEVTKK